MVELVVCGDVDVAEPDAPEPPQPATAVPAPSVAHTSAARLSLSRPDIPVARIYSATAERIGGRSITGTRVTAPSCHGRR